MVGVSAALALAEAGVPVTLCEKGLVAAEQSSRNWGWIRKQNRDRRELPLMKRADALWRAHAEGSPDFGYRRGGVTFLARHEGELAERAAFLADAREHQLDTRLLSSAEVDQMLGQSDRRFAGGLTTPSDAYAEPQRAMRSLKARARAAGVEIAERTAARTLVRRAGAVCGVATERGEIACDRVILAGGVWSRTFLENLGQSLPQLGVRASVMRTSRAPQVCASTFGTEGASIRPRADGGYTVARSGAARFDLIPAAFAHFKAFLPTLRTNRRILKLRAGASFFGPLGRHRWDGDEVSPFEVLRVMDLRPDDALLDDVLRSAQDTFAHLRGVRSEARWAGMIDVTPDEIPIIDTVDAIPGLTIATGFSGHGFGIGPAAGELAAQMTTGRTPLVDPTPFRLSRFAGSA